MAWDLALRPSSATILPLTPDFLARIAATPSDTPLARSRREVACTVGEAKELLRVLGEAAGKYARSGDHQPLWFSPVGCSNVINAMKAVLEGPAGSGSAAGGG